LFSLFPAASLTSPTASARTASRAAFLERLRTYTSDKFFGKPSCISPLICAAHGYTCSSVDTLTCTACATTLDFTIDPTHSFDSANILAEYYAEQLIAGHEGGCVHKLNPVNVDLYTTFPKERLEVLDYNNRCLVMRSKLGAAKGVFDATKGVFDATKGALDASKGPLDVTDVGFGGCVENMVATNWAVTSVDEVAVVVECDLCGVAKSLAMVPAQASRANSHKRKLRDEEEGLEGLEELGGSGALDVFDVVNTHRYFCPCASTISWVELLDNVNKERQKSSPDMSKSDVEGIDAADAARSLMKRTDDMIDSFYK
jgi:hypothetical protein